MTYAPTMSVVIPTYERGAVLLNTLKSLLNEPESIYEILVIDQTDYQPNDDTAAQLAVWNIDKTIRWLRRSRPSIPEAMNVGLIESRGDLVLFLDDDIKPHTKLAAKHAETFTDTSVVATVGQVLQPGQSPQTTVQKTSKKALWNDFDFTFNGMQAADISNCMAGNLCVRRIAAIECGGFDERFIGTAYRFETEFIRRLIRSSGKRCCFVPAAGIDHLQIESGGTRSHSQNHLQTPSIIDGLGDYYFAYRTSRGLVCWQYCGYRLFRSLRTRFYLRKPWLLPRKLWCEIRAMLMAKRMASLQPKLLRNGMRPKKKFAAVISHPIQHYSPLFRVLNQYEEIDVHVFYLCDVGIRAEIDPGFGVQVKWDVPLLDGYESTILKPGFTPQHFSFWEMSAPGFIQRLAEFEPDFIWLHGYAQKFIWDAVGWAQRRSTTIHFADSELLHSRHYYNRLFKQLALRVFFSRCDLFMTIGNNNEAYYRHYGVTSDKLFRGACPVDVLRLGAARKSEPESVILDLKQSLKIAADAFVILFSGKLVDYKRPCDLLYALVDLPLRAHVIFLGDGPERHHIQTLTTELGIRDRVTLTGFINQSEVHRYMMLADILAVTSERDAHPLVVTEGLVFGLPVVIADRVGCVGGSDTARPDKNALVYQTGNVTELINAIEKLMDNSGLYTSMSEYSLSLVESQSVEVVADIIHSLMTGRRLAGG